MFKVMIRDNMSPVAREILEATGTTDARKILGDTAREVYGLGEAA